MAASGELRIPRRPRSRENGAVYNSSVISGQVGVVVCSAVGITVASEKEKPNHPRWRRVGGALEKCCSVGDSAKNQPVQSDEKGRSSLLDGQSWGPGDFCWARRRNPVTA